MISPFKIRYLSTAENDLDDIFTYILRDKPSSAASLLKNFDRSISQLAFNPELGVVPKDERLKKLGYRTLVVGKYLIFYVVKGKTVQIRRVTRTLLKKIFMLPCFMPLNTWEMRHLSI